MDNSVYYEGYSFSSLQPASMSSDSSDSSEDRFSVDSSRGDGYSSQKRVRIKEHAVPYSSRPVRLRVRMSPKSSVKADGQKPALRLDYSRPVSPRGSRRLVPLSKGVDFLGVSMRSPVFQPNTLPTRTQSATPAKDKSASVSVLKSSQSISDLSRPSSSKAQKKQGKELRVESATRIRFSQKKLSYKDQADPLAVGAIENRYLQMTPMESLEARQRVASLCERYEVQEQSNAWVVWSRMNQSESGLVEFVYNQKLSELVGVEENGFQMTPRLETPATLRSFKMQQRARASSRLVPTTT